MNGFTASNGIEVHEQPGGGLYISDACRASTARAQALREFFRAEEDARLGRWRWAEDPDFLVYPEVGGLHRVVRESTGESQRRNGLVSADAWGHAACAYRIAHPEPKPWHDAKPGEVWLITSNGGTYVDEPAIVVGDRWMFRSAFDIARVDSVRADGIKAARRIYPEPTV